MTESSVVAIGRLEPDGAWAGLRPTTAGYEIVFGEPDGSAVAGPAGRAELIALAIGYFEEALDDPPPEIEATHHDVAQLLTWLHARELDGATRRLLLEALEGIDDGVAGDVMIGRLSRAFDAVRMPNEQAAPLDLLVERYRALRR